MVCGFDFGFWRIMRRYNYRLKVSSDKQINIRSRKELIKKTLYVSNFIKNLFQLYHFR